MKRLNSLHRRAAKLIQNNVQVSVELKLKNLNFLPLDKQLKFNKAIIMYKVYHNEMPNYILTLFQKATKRYGSINFRPPLPRIDLFKTSLAFSGSMLWNSLPSHIKSLNSLKIFKKALHRYYQSV